MRGAGTVGSGGQMIPLPPEIYLWVKHGISTPRFFGRNIFQYTGQLILIAKSLKLFLATSCQILRLKCTRFD